MNPHGYMCEHVGSVFLGLDLVAAKEYTLRAVLCQRWPAGAAAAAPTCIVSRGKGGKWVLTR